MRPVTTFTHVAVAGALIALATAHARAEEPERESPEGPRVGGDAVVRVYDVEDLMNTPAALKRLVDMIEAVIGPGTDASVSAVAPGRVIVRAPAGALKRVDALLAKWRGALGGALVSVTARVIRSDEPVLAFGGDAGWRVRFPRARLPKVLEAIRAADDMNLIVAPRVVCFDGQQARISVTKQVSYVKDFEVVVDDAGVKAADPIVATLHEGFTLDVTPKRIGGGVRLDLTGGMSVLQRPIATEERKEPGIERPLRIQKPELGEAKAEEKDLRVPEGEVLFLSLGHVPRADGSGREYYGVILETAPVNAPAPAGAPK